MAYFKDRYTVITWDVPLHGLSRPYTDFSYENKAKDLCAILDTEQIEQVFLAGISLGGYPLHMIENAAHFSNGDNAKQVNQEIEDFLRKG